jgi:hypothetical protein
MVQDFQQFCFFERGNGLARLVVIHKDHLEAGWVEQIALTRNATIESRLVDDPVLVYFIAQDAAEKITDVPVRGKSWHADIRGRSALSRHHLAYRRIPGLRTQNLCEVLEETEAIDNAIRFCLHPQRAQRQYGWRASR